MSWTTPRTWITGEVLSKALLDQQLRDNLAYLKVNIGLEAAVELTISGGAVTKTCAHHKIDTEEDDASDDLDTISGGIEGEALFIRPANGSRTVVVKHNVGNIWNPAGSDIEMDEADDYCLLIYSGSKWTVIGGGGGSFTNLIDAPSDYTDQGGKAVAVKVDESGLEFIDFPAGYTDEDAVAAAKADTDIADAIDKKHSNSLDHAQGTDQVLDDGGENEVGVVDIKSAVDLKHAQAHKLNSHDNPDGAVAFAGQQATNLVVHSVADSIAREALTKVAGKLCFQSDSGELYICKNE